MADAPFVQLEVAAAAFAVGRAVFGGGGGSSSSSSNLKEEGRQEVLCGGFSVDFRGWDRPFPNSHVSDANADAQHFTTHPPSLYVRRFFVFFFFFQVPFRTSDMIFGSRVDLA
jgi:hypothetical protein